MGEDDTPGVKLLEPLNPICDRRAFVVTDVRARENSAQVCGIRTGAVVRLAGEDDGSIIAADHERLMSRCVSRRGDYPDAGKQLDLSVDLFVGHAAKLDELRNGVVLLVSAGELNGLDNYWSAREGWIPSTMIEVEMAVDDPAHFTDSGAGRAQGFRERPPARAVVSFRLIIRESEAGVEQHPAGAVGNEVAEHRLHARLSRPGLRGRADEIPVINASDVVSGHVASQSQPS